MWILTFLWAYERILSKTPSEERGLRSLKPADTENRSINFWTDQCYWSGSNIFIDPRSRCGLLQHQDRTNNETLKQHMCNTNVSNVMKLCVFVTGWFSSSDHKEQVWTVLPVWQWWATDLWGSGCGSAASLEVHCGSQEEARRRMSGSSSSSSEQQNNMTPRPVCTAAAGLRSPRRTSEGRTGSDVITPVRVRVTIRHRLITK